MKPANVREVKKKMLIAMLEGLQPCTIVCFALIHYA